MDLDFLWRFWDGTWTSKDLWELGKFFVGAVTVLLSALPAVRWWYSLERTKKRLLEEYLAVEGSKLAEKRNSVFARIQSAPNNTGNDLDYDLDREIELAMNQLDNRQPDKATGVLNELLGKIDNRLSVEKKRIDLLNSQKASVSVFLAAVFDRRDEPDHGLKHIQTALQLNSRDKDALKYRGLLLLKQGQAQPAAVSFIRLIRACVGATDAQIKAEAHELLGRAYLAFAPPSYKKARESAKRAQRLIVNHLVEERDHALHGRILEMLGDIALKTLPKENDDTAQSFFEQSLRAFQAVRRHGGQDSVRNVKAKLKKITDAQSRSNSTSLHVN